MTRKKALEEAIHIVANARIGKQRKADLLDALDLCRRELPFSRWSREAIFDACDTWVQERGELSVRAFASRQMPSHTVIQNRFGMTAREFRDRYYPLSSPPAGGRYQKRGAEEWNALFIREFSRLGCTGQKDYNSRRDRGLPTWNTMAAMNGCGTWRQLLKLCGLETYGKPRPGMEVRILPPEE